MSQAARKQCRVTFNRQRHKMTLTKHKMCLCVGEFSTRASALDLEVVCVISVFCLINSPAFGKKKKKKNRSQTHITSNHPFTLSGCWHVTQLVTAWITLHEALGERITVEIQFCATSNVRIDPSDSL